MKLIIGRVYKSKSTGTYYKYYGLYGDCKYCLFTTNMKDPLKGEYSHVKPELVSTYMEFCSDKELSGLENNKTYFPYWSESDLVPNPK